MRHCLFHPVGIFPKDYFTTPHGATNPTGGYSCIHSGGGISRIFGIYRASIRGRIIRALVSSLPGARNSTRIIEK
jgi:hypothetical protein